MYRVHSCTHRWPQGSVKKRNGSRRGWATCGLPKPQSQNTSEVQSVLLPLLPTDTAVCGAGMSPRRIGPARDIEEHTLMYL